MQVLVLLRPELLLHARLSFQLGAAGLELRQHRDRHLALLVHLLHLKIAR